MKCMPITIATLALLVAAGTASAQTCPSGTTRVTAGTTANPIGARGNNFTEFITGATVCAARGADRWQEFHKSGGDLIDWKLGAGHPVDPTKKVGTWSAQDGNNATVTHTYGSFVVAWAVCRVSTSVAPNHLYTLVSTNAGTVTGVSILAGQQACPSSP